MQCAGGSFCVQLLFTVVYLQKIRYCVTIYARIFGLHKKQEDSVATFSLPIFVNRVSLLLKGKYSRDAHPKATWNSLFDQAFLETAERFADHWSAEDLHELKREVGSILGSRPRTKRKLATEKPTPEYRRGHVWKITRDVGGRIAVHADDASGIIIVFLATGTEVTWISVQGNPGRDTIEEAAEEVRILLRKEAESNKQTPKPATLERVRLIAIHDERLAYIAEVIRENNMDDRWTVWASQGKSGRICLLAWNDSGVVVTQKNIPTSLLEKVRGDAKGRFRGAGTGVLPGV